MARSENERLRYHKRIHDIFKDIEQHGCSNKWAAFSMRRFYNTRGYLSSKQIRFLAGMVAERKRTSSVP